MRLMCVLTVLWAITSSSAISALVNPAAIKRRTSNSRSESASSGAPGETCSPKAIKSCFTYSGEWPCAAAICSMAAMRGPLSMKARTYPSGSANRSARAKQRVAASRFPAACIASERRAMVSMDVRTQPPASSSSNTLPNTVSASGILCSARSKRPKASFSMACADWIACGSSGTLNPRLDAHLVAEAISPRPMFKIASQARASSRQGKSGISRAKSSPFSMASRYPASSLLVARILALIK